MLARSVGSYSSTSSIILEDSTSAKESSRLFDFKNHFFQSSLVVRPENHCFRQVPLGPFDSHRVRKWEDINHSRDCATIVGQGRTFPRKKIEGRRLLDYSHHIETTQTLLANLVKPRPIVWECKECGRWYTEDRPARLCKVMQGQG